MRAAHASQANVLIHTDAYDCVCLQPLGELLEKFQALKHPIVFSFEGHHQPEYWLALNSGLVVAHREAFLDVFALDGLEECFPDHFNDQNQIQMLYSWHPEWFSLDTDSRLFYTQTPRVPPLVQRGGSLVNPLTGTKPSFVHGPHNSDLSNVDEWIASLKS